MSSRSLNAEHQPRSIRIAGKLNEPQRISRHDEATLSTRVKRKRLAEKLAELESDGQAVLREMRIDRNIASMQTQREIGSGIASFGRARSKVAQTL